MSRPAGLRPVLWGALSLVLTTGCASPSTSGAPPATVDAETSPSSVLGAFPPFPEGGLSGGAALQATLDEAVEDGTVRGVGAAVVVVGSGSWAGAAGVDLNGRALRADSPLPTASVGKTVTAAQMLRLVDERTLGLDDRAADRFPSELSGFDANDASIRDLLGMRSGLRDPYGYEDLVDQGHRTAALAELVPPPSAAPGSGPPAYANLNYLLLGEIIEHVTGLRLAEAVKEGVLADPLLSGIVYRVEDAMAADGWNIEADPATLARWGYELYGGHVVSDHALREMTDFGGEFYGLGTIDLSGTNEYGAPGAVGHGGLGVSLATRLVAFPDSGTVVSVQANADGLDQIRGLVKALRDAAGS